ncbi:MAG: amidohydrolase family protein [Firmicutes bacterium]|nr:amidohydrolase family protein [Bacillota bacterium]
MLIKNCRLYDMAGLLGVYRDIRIEGGKISAVAEKLEPAEGEEVFDAAGRIVTPGLVDAGNSAGISVQVHRFDRQDANEQGNPIQSQMRALDAFYMFDEGIDQMRESGVTSMLSGPGSDNLIGGTYVAVKTAGKSFGSRVIKEEAAFKFVLTNAPRKNYGGKQKSPQTRMATGAMIRGELYKAKAYYDAKASGKPQGFDLKLESLARVFDGMLCKFYAVSENDIRLAVSIAEEFGLNYTVDMAQDAFIMQDFLAAHKVRICMGSLYGNTGGQESDEGKLDNAAKLNDAKFDWCMESNHPMLNGQVIQPYMCLLRKWGLAPEKILAAWTIKAAEFAGIADRVGSIEAGKDADILVWSGDPLDYYSNIDLMLIDGEKV